MLRKVVVVLAIAVVLGSSALSTSAFARRGGGRMEGDGCRRIAGDGYCGYGGHVSGLPSGFQGYGQRDAWGHWGAYYGPMVHVPY